MSADKVRIRRSSPKEFSRVAANITAQVASLQRKVDELESKVKKLEYVIGSEHPMGIAIDLDEDLAVDPQLKKSRKSKE